MFLSPDKCPQPCKAFQKAAAITQAARGTHIDTHTHSHSYTLPQLHTHTHTDLHTHSTFIHIRSHISHPHVHSCSYTHCTFMHTPTHAHTGTHSCTCTHTHLTHSDPPTLTHRLSHTHTTQTYTYSLTLTSSQRTVLSNFRNGLLFPLNSPRSVAHVREERTKAEGTQLSWLSPWGLICIKCPHMGRRFYLGNTGRCRRAVQ
jgi:hypothetical protein